MTYGITHLEKFELNMKSQIDRNALWSMHHNEPEAAKIKKDTQWNPLFKYFVAIAIVKHSIHFVEKQNGPNLRISVQVIITNTTSLLYFGL